MPINGKVEAGCRAYAVCVDDDLIPLEVLMHNIRESLESIFGHDNVCVLGFMEAGKALDALREIRGIAEQTNAAILITTDMNLKSDDGRDGGDFIEDVRALSLPPHRLMRISGSEDLAPLPGVIDLSKPHEPEELKRIIEQFFAPASS